MTERTSFTYKLSAREQALLTGILKQGNYRPFHLEHAKIAAKADACTIALYKSGKCLVQGKKAADFITFVLEPLVLKSAELGYEDVLNPEAVAPHMGVDESGKGDFFGPIVAAGVYIDPSLAEAMREMNVRDSKNITSDLKAVHMGRDLRKLLGRRYSVVKIGPEAYNRLYAKMRNVNTLLGWAHARAIENLLEIVPDCPRAISDKFGREDQIQRSLMQKGRRIELVQRHRAESDLAVAAASIIARESFLLSLKDMREKYKLKFPKGASSGVKEVALELIRKNGPKVLLETAKCHFKTTDAVLKQIRKDRGVLGPEGRAVSRTRSWQKHKKRPASQEP
jgi:ribonuclease HIII